MGPYLFIYLFMYLFIHFFIGSLDSQIFNSRSVFIFSSFFIVFLYIFSYFLILAVLLLLCFFSVFVDPQPAARSPQPAARSPHSDGPRFLKAFDICLELPAIRKRILVL